MDNKITIDDIFNDDDFGLLDSAPQSSHIKSADDRLIDSFEEINVFVDKHNREPNSSSMSEYGLRARLKTFREDENKKKILRLFDRHNLLGHAEVKKLTVDDILNDDDDDLLDTDKELSIFRYKHIPKPEERAEADFVAQRKPMKEEDFKPYEAMFQKVHQEIKAGKRKVKPFRNIEKNLHPGNFYIIEGVLLYLESAELETEVRQLKSGNRVRKDGRTVTIFENGTSSNMLYRSLGKQIQKNGKLVTNTDRYAETELFVNANLVKEEDIQTGWVYILKSKSQNPEIANIKDLYKIGFSSVPIDDRIKHAKNEATYLFAEVQKVRSYR
ncbi:MAG: GIY-YIG nuclease family protein, partial [Bacteroidales bacterium]|nr:GIY-YIG nuclease family protein [Bacteroidales bacterium]